jgi:hypothetical protein
MELTTGLSRDIAQEQFISEAEEMGIQEVDWEQKNRLNNMILTGFVPWAPNVNLIANGHESQKWCPVTPKLRSRSALPISSIVEDDIGNSLFKKAAKGGLSLSLGLGLLTELGIFVWMGLRHRNNSKAGGKRRVHARSWNNAADSGTTTEPLCALSRF